MSKIDPDQIAYGGFETGHTIRSDMAKTMMQGLLANYGYAGSQQSGRPSDYKFLATHAVLAADALITALNKAPHSPPSPDPTPEPDDISVPF